MYISNKINRELCIYMLINKKLLMINKYKN